MTILPSKRKMHVSFSKQYNKNGRKKLEGGPGTTGFTVGDDGGGGGGGC